MTIDNDVRRRQLLLVGKVGLNAPARSQRPTLNPASATFPEQLSPSQRVLVFRLLYVARDAASVRINQDQ